MHEISSLMEGFSGRSISKLFASVHCTLTGGALNDAMEPALSAAALKKIVRKEVERQRKKDKLLEDDVSW